MQDSAPFQITIDLEQILPWFTNWVFSTATATTESLLISLALLLALAVFLGFRVFNFFGKFGPHGLIGRPSHYDEERLFTMEQKRRGHRRAGYRCEFEGFLFFRCKSESSHADHYFSYSRGGATTMRNFVAACPTHNMSKGKKMPKASERFRLQRRRRKYFPSDELVQAGEWTTKLMVGVPAYHR